jgi:hypothetical protein
MPIFPLDRNRQRHPGEHLRADPPQRSSGEPDG